MHAVQALLIGDAHGQPAGIVECLSLQNNRGPQPTARCHLHQGCKSRHHNGHGNAEQFSVVCQTQGMVASRGSHNAPLFLRIVQQEQRIAGPAFFERTGALQEVQLAPDLGTCEK